MLTSLGRKLVATTVLVVIGLAPTLVTPAYAGSAPATPAPSATSEPIAKTAEVVAGSVAETRQAVSEVLTANDAARLWPAVDADLTPKLESLANTGGTVDSEVASLALRIKIRIKCTISFPPLRIKCTITIIIIVSSSGGVPARYSGVPAKL